jgi:chromosome segregation ATPase
MTPTSYYVALIAKSFGYERRHKRLADASSEMALLREAEYQLGSTLWEKVEPVKELAVEYWNLRKFVKERDQHVARLNELNERLSILHEERAVILNESSAGQDTLEVDRTELLLDLEKLAVQKEQVIRRAKEIRRAHEGLLTKIEVLERDGSSPEAVKEVQGAIAELKQEFIELKQKRQKIADALEDGDLTIDAIEKQMIVYKQEKRDRAAVIFQQMGVINRELSNIRSEIGACDSQIRHLQAEVGRYISRYYKRNEACAEIAKLERTMVEVMRMLRISIVMNHRLADFK